MAADVDHSSTSRLLLDWGQLLILLSFYCLVLFAHFLLMQLMRHRTCQPQIASQTAPTFLFKIVFYQLYHCQNLHE